MKRLLLTVAVAICVTGGSVLARFSIDVIPTEFLIRPLIFAALLGIVIALLSMTAGRYAPLVAAAGALAVMAATWWTFVGYLVVVAGAGLAEHRGWTVDTVRPTLASAAVFAALALIIAFPNIEFRSGDMPEGMGGPPLKLILLDGYSRPDVLREIGVDISSFVHAMKARGFDHYPAARSTTYYTHWTLARMLTGEEGDGWGTVSERREIRDSLELPQGFVTVAPGVSHVTISSAVDVGSGGVNNFEFELVRQSALAHFPWVGEMMLDLWRKRIDESLSAVATTKHDRVFAHIIAPHVPYLYGPNGEPLGMPTCWPKCSPFWVHPVNHAGLESTIQWLNGRLVETVDQILASRPDAVIVLFGDHGLRVTDIAEEDNYKPLLLARTPGSPGLFIDTPQPDVVFQRVLATQSVTGSIPEGH